MGLKYLSLFSGIEAATVAWSPLGMEPVAFSEIEPFPCALLAEHYPDIPNLGDITKITDDDIKALGPFDIVVGGSPCQDLSVAGQQKGLEGERSGLFYEQLRIFHAAKSLCGARYLLWENVPGAFSSNAGRDFASVVGAMAGADFGVPRNGWKSAGAAVGSNGLVEWRVLDAQYVRTQSHPRAVPQRRRRVFALLDTGDWQNRGPILLEREGMQRNTAPRRETGEGVASYAASSIGQYRAGVGTLRAEGGDNGGGSENLICMSSGQANAEITENVGPCLNLNRDGAPILAFQSKASASNSMNPSEIAPTLDKGKADGIAIAIRTAQTSSNGHGFSEDTAYTLDQANGQAVAFAQNQRNEVRIMDKAGALAAETGTKQQTYIANDMKIRRLLPVECERLMGMPDGYTAITYRKKPAADGPRYRALGNSMAVNVMNWIGSRLNA